MSAPNIAAKLGLPDDPSTETIARLAEFFPIKPRYFTDDDYYEELDVGNELTWWASSRDQAARRIGAGRRTVN